MIRFIELNEVVKAHDDLVFLYGGCFGVRDFGLLEAALAQPQMSFGGHYLHTDIFTMAAAYAYHLIKNHPFVDGNKRTASVIMLIFLKRNNIDIVLSQAELYNFALGVATAKISKGKLAQKLRAYSKIRVSHGSISKPRSS